MSSNGTIRTERHDDVFEIVIDRPQKYNGFTPAMFVELAQAYTEYEKGDARCALLRAEGKHFTAGLDLTSVDPSKPLFPGGQGLIDPLGLEGPFRSKPVVQAVQGICFTIGIELGLANDIVIAASDARFSQLEVKRGLYAFGGATLRMPARAGWGNAMMVLLTGDEFTAEQALRYGFIQEVVTPDALLARAREIAKKIAAQAPLAVQATIRTARAALEGARAAAMPTYRAELDALLKSEDFAEGRQSFVERRDGHFKGK